MAQVGRDSAKGILALLLVGAVMGFVFGSVYGDRKVRDALDWAVEQTRECENHLVEAGDYPDVTACLRHVVDIEDEARRIEKQASAE